MQQVEKTLQVVSQRLMYTHSYKNILHFFVEILAKKKHHDSRHQNPNQKPGDLRSIHLGRSSSDPGRAEAPCDSTGCTRWGWMVEPLNGSTKRRSNFQSKQRSFGFQVYTYIYIHICIYTYIYICTKVSIL